MTQGQVKFLLGTPLLEDPFDPRRWEYVYYYRSPKGAETSQKLSLYFESERLARIVHDKPETLSKQQAANKAKTKKPTTAPQATAVDNRATTIRAATLPDPAESSAPAQVTPADPAEAQIIEASPSSDEPLPAVDPNYRLPEDSPYYFDDPLFENPANAREIRETAQEEQQQAEDAKKESAAPSKGKSDNQTSDPNSEEPSPYLDFEPVLPELE